ncbi:TetR/AcrR family transcriptional regulator [Ruegeria aquimaris]|uniref:TetR/AcrR family transcriptional regulator n=1 Tax=Ruegeria aquimaris TaxID=2984333 RepID=A0ABT3AG17_9RHOB|nr:TetR/AcrR family transcriptional regulator [Ruegeria sp. XHP0148]MCV2887619.1 TetR/AcrR family transcriptional regulator [Ruegeria sp. XHP0148]
MKDNSRADRQQQIEEAAYALLEQKGYAGTSMQGIARLARASNETLYSWYGDKQGLFRALVIRNAAEVRAQLEADLAAARPPRDTLAALGPRLLSLLLGDRAVALNRAAAADPSGELGTLIAQSGRDSVMPLIVQVLKAARDEGLLRFDDAGAAAGLYLDLLVGDQQIRRVIGRLPAPSEAACQSRGVAAVTHLCRLLG